MLVCPTPQGEALLERVRQARQHDVAQALPNGADLSAMRDLLTSYVTILAQTVYPEGDYPPKLFI